MMDKKCSQCPHLNYRETKCLVNGYYCCHPDNLLGPRLVKECARYQVGYRTPRWCPEKLIKREQYE